MSPALPATHEVATGLFENDTKGAYSLAGQVHKERKLIHGHDVRDHGQASPGRGRSDT